MGVLHRLKAREAAVGSATVRRVLPRAVCRKVGPWVFLDHFGPTTAIGGSALDVGPHPHCGLSTVSYLFEGAVLHRDSLGNRVRIGPGEIHWMRAGHGIVHSERTPPDLVGKTVRTHGLQLWCAHPDGEEDQPPAFGSWTDLPEFATGSARVRLLAGDGWGRRSPVAVTSPLVYAIAEVAAGGTFDLPDHPERCVYPVQGRIVVDDDAAEPHEMLVVDPRAHRVAARTDAVVAVLGGAPIGTRHMWWNLVHSDRGRLAEQADRWRAGRFPPIDDPGAPIEAPPGP